MEGYPCPFSRRRNLAIAVSKMVTTVVRHYDQDERQSDGSMHWDTTQLGAVESICKTWRTTVLRKVLVVPCSWRKQQGKKWVLWGFHKILSLLSSNSPWVDGICSNSLPLEKVCLLQRLFFQPSIYPGEWIDSGWTLGDKGRQTVFLTQLKIITPFLEKRTTVIGSEIKMPFAG